MIRFFQLAFPHDVSYWCTGTDHCKKYLSNEARRWALVSSSLAWEKTGKRKQRRQVIKFQTIFDEQNHKIPDELVDPRVLKATQRHNYYA